MTTKMAFNFLEKYRFKQSKKAQIIDTFKNIQFSGELIWIAPSDEKKWTFYFCQGRIVYATGGTHSVRRWARNLTAYCPQIRVDITELRQIYSNLNSDFLIDNWEYKLFGLWIDQGKISQDHAQKLIQSVLEEVLFDLSQEDGLTHQIKEHQCMSKPLALIDEMQAIEEVQQLWQSLWEAKFTGYSLNTAPIIKQPEQLKKYTSEKIYNALSQLLNGENTLRDLAIKMKRDVVQVTRLLLPYIKSELVDLVSISDLPNPVNLNVSELSSKQVNPTKPLIACVDDSAAVCQTLDKLLTAAGYRFIGINEGLRALTSLLTSKPDLIFLDLMMPHTNGYEICSQLRKAPSFRNTPIIILTANDGIVDQVRAKLFGATDFLSKPVDAGKVLSAISKHLTQSKLVREGGEIEVQ